MKCPNCGSYVADGSKYCTECGTLLNSAQGSRPGSERGVLESATAGGLAMGQAARQARMNASYAPEELISDRAYNGILAGVVLWGLLINALLCAYVGDVFRYVNPILFLILYMVCAFAGIRIASRSRNPVVSFLGYNLLVVPFGLMISTLVHAYGGLDAQVVRDAFVYTLLITLGMMATVMIAPNLYQKLGGVLLGCLVGLLLAEIVLLLFRVDQVVTDWIAAGLFSLYIGYDIYRSQQFPKTVDNAVDSALDIYLDIANLFIRLLSILGRRKD